MAGVCKLIMEENFSKEEKMEMMKAAMEESTQSFTEKKKGLFGGVKDFVKHFTTEDAAVFDMFKDANDANKIKKNFTRTFKRLNWAYQPINKNKKAVEIYNYYRRSKQILNMLDNLSREQAVEQISEFRSFIRDGGSDIEQFRNNWKAKLKKAESTIATFEPLSETHKRNMEFAKEKVDRLSLEFPDEMSKLLEGVNDPLDALDKIQFKLWDAKGKKNITEYYKKILRVDVNFTSDKMGTRFLDTVSHHVLDKYQADLRLHKHIVKDNINHELIDELSKINGGVEKITPEYIQSLHNDHDLKVTFNSIFDIVTSSKENISIYDNMLKVHDGDTFKAIEQTLKQMTARDILKDNSFLTNKVVQHYIESYKDTFPELRRVINGSNYDASKIHEEISKYNKMRGTDFKLNNKNHFNNELNKNAIKEMNRLIKKEKLGNAENIMEALSQRFPNHTLVTSNGTEVLSTGNKFIDIKDNKDILGHIVDLSDPKFVFDDATLIKSIQDSGQEGLLNAIASGKVNIIPKEHAETMTRIKRSALAEVKSFGLNRINKIFTMSTLFAPWNVPGYVTGTQIFGNIAHTMTADPAAFKHWPKMIKHIKEAVSGDINNIEDADARRILEYIMTSEGNSLLSISSDDFGFAEDPEFLKELEELEVQRKSQEGINITAFERMLNEWVKKSTKFVAIVEAVSRGSMAYEIIQKKNKGKQYIPPTANPHRVEHLWGFDDHLAAVRMANDTHIDYGSLPPVIRRISRWMPFFSFKAGSSMNMVRQIKFTMEAVKDAINGTGDWKKARSFMGRGAVSILWRAGVAATIWGTIMAAMGFLSDDKRKRLNKQAHSNIFNELLGKAGINLDKGFYMPGTGFTPFDKLMRIGKLNQKGDVFSDAESMIPGLDKEWRENGFNLETGAKRAAGIVGSGFSPIIKTPIEIMMGGGTIYDSGYRQRPSYESFGESLVGKASTFMGLGSLTRATFYEMHGRPTEYRSEGAQAAQDVLGEFNDKLRDNSGAFDARKAIGNRMRYMDVEGTGEAIRAYEHILSQGGGLSQTQINSKIRSAIKYYTIASKVKSHPELIQGKSDAELTKIQQGIQAQQDFLNAIGFGRW